MNGRFFDEENTELFNLDAFHFPGEELPSLKSYQQPPTKKQLRQRRKELNEYIKNVLNICLDAYWRRDYQLVDSKISLTIKKNGRAYLETGIFISTIRKLFTYPEKKAIVMLAL